MHELASASPPNIRINLFIIYSLNGYFMIDSAPIYNIQDHPAFHFALVKGSPTTKASTCINVYL